MADSNGPLAHDLIAALELSAEILPVHQATYALIGGIATGLRSRLRFTEDIDLLVRVPKIRLPGLLEALVERGFQCDVVATVREWVEHHLVVLRYQSIRVDWLEPVLPAYHHVLETATAETWRGKQLRVATAEGLILTKLIAARDQDWADINGLLAANRARIDLDWIKQEWNTVFSTKHGRWTRFRTAVAEYYDRSAE